MTLPKVATEAIETYQMHVSTRYLDLTKKKLELTRLPRELDLPEERRWEYGTPKKALEPIVDFWMEEYDWRVQETNFNNCLPQFRTAINLDEHSLSKEEQSKTRIHFAHKRSSAPRALPLLFCHGWPPSFTEVMKIIEPLSDPISTPPRGSQDALGFHVVAPSIPGFGFSDAVHSESFGLRKTAEIFDTLMKRLGYQEYVAYGGDWGFKICRMLALHHQSSCRAIYTNSPDMPLPAFRVAPVTYLKYHIARLTKGRISFLRFGYTLADISASGGRRKQRLSTTPFEDQSFRPQTTAYSLCDSPIGLLANMLDAIRPSLALKQWSNTDILNWTMMHWLPGPEAALRWLRQSSREARKDCWNHYSPTPLGISSFGRLAEEQIRSPPPWAEGWQRLCWLRRHERAAKWPAWDAPEETVIDIRECFGEMIEQRLLVFEQAGATEVD
ncbi:MAG: hypothetical protein M1822_002813 [Bathelium mastoideum]|nr:MAG: hypothetical protein M1822_002813 [Bathelium mastoideum]